MFSRSCLDLLNLLSVDDFRSVGRIPRVMTAEGVLCDFDTDGAGHGAPLDRRIVVANQLPVRAVWDQDAGKWGFEWDGDSLVLQLKDGLHTGTEVVYVGSLAVEVAAADQDEVVRVLWDGFRCVPTLLPSDLRTGSTTASASTTSGPCFTTCSRCRRARARISTAVSGRLTCP
ncbi:hypothetical protein MLD38_014917 [Melastoma candidum]|uniref:Uncharacterized protein n=1 Tax=Melastoma candidum TaxID=119954 RepID=A0ACB9RMT8_9MYRT|nr:hypothetical protein MLD38_014917 [Melastoma candidum]